MIFTKLKSIIYCLVAVLVIILSSVIAIQHYKINKLDNKLEIANTNVKALMLSNRENKNEIRSLELTIEQLEYCNDSIIKKLNKASQELNIKSKDIKNLQYLKTLASKSDTVYISDTIFVEDFCLDTIIGDKWSNSRIELCYPNEVIVEPSFVSEKFIITHIKKETVDPPKKCWLARLFQKKHKVLIVQVKEDNPYVDVKEFMHIEVIK